MVGGDTQNAGCRSVCASDHNSISPNVSFMKDDFNCNICLEICVDAVETSCCGHIFCPDCVGRLWRCPMCRVVATPGDIGHRRVFQPALFIRRLIADLASTCPHCGGSFKLGQLDVHVAHCLDMLPTPDGADELCSHGGSHSPLLDMETIFGDEDVEQNPLSATSARAPTVVSRPVALGSNQSGCGAPAEDLLIFTPTQAHQGISAPVLTGAFSPMPPLELPISQLPVAPVSPVRGISVPISPPFLDPFSNPDPFAGLTSPLRSESELPVERFPQQSQRSLQDTTQGGVIPVRCGCGKWIWGSAGVGNSPTAAACTCHSV